MIEYIDSLGCPWPDQRRPRTSFDKTVILVRLGLVILLFATLINHFREPSGHRRGDVVTAEEQRKELEEAIENLLAAAEKLGFELTITIKSGNNPGLRPTEPRPPADVPPPSVEIRSDSGRRLDKPLEVALDAYEETQ